ncbi:MAG: hydantoinase/oxoprolinase family protein [Actinomycetota bacterium]
MTGWQFWIDRGGTFTDVVAVRPDGATVTHKLLSENPRRYDDAAIQGIRDLLEVDGGEPMPSHLIDAVKMGTTVATNALLERHGDPTALVTTRGFADALRIGYQHRPDLFALDIVLPEMLYENVVEIDERLSADGKVLVELDAEAARRDLAAVKAAGIDGVAIALLHGYRYTDHEARLASIAREIGFGQVSVSHEVSPLMKLVSRGDTTVVDAYLSPVLRRYVDRVRDGLGDGPRLSFMQSNGGLTEAGAFQGKDALLSGPAGGVVGMVRTAAAAGFDRLVGFDMGGTSTDVAHYAGALERTYETEVAGVRVRAPMIDIHTVAAGGGSILQFDGARLRVGPDSAGADPGPACYGNAGPLAVTDANVLLGKLRPEFFPRVFGPGGDEPLDVEATRAAFEALAVEVRAATGSDTTPEELAEGFLAIAVDNMANAIKKISVQRGHDVTDHTLVCFGGAAGQHACLVADRLGISRIQIHPHAGVLSALGIGLADTRHVVDEPVEAVLDDDLVASLDQTWHELGDRAIARLVEQGLEPRKVELAHRLALRYHGSDTVLRVDAGPRRDVVAAFEASHRAQFGFVSPDKAIVVESLQVEAVGAGEALPTVSTSGDGTALGSFDAVMGGRSVTAPFLRRPAASADPVLGPAVIVDATTTTVVEPGWAATTNRLGDLVLDRVEDRPHHAAVG